MQESRNTQCIIDELKRSGSLIETKSRKKNVVTVRTSENFQVGNVQQKRMPKGIEGGRRRGCGRGRTNGNRTSVILTAFWRALASHPKNFASIDSFCVTFFFFAS